MQALTSGTFDSRLPYPAAEPALGEPAGELLMSVARTAHADLSPGREPPIHEAPRVEPEARRPADLATLRAALAEIAEAARILHQARSREG